MGRLGRFTSNALVIGLVGAAVAFAFGIAGQRIARSWQKEDERLDIRASLVRRVSETSAEFVGVVRLRGMGVVDSAALDAAYRKWAVASNSIGGELSAYVGEGDAATRWRNFRTNMGYVYYLFRAKTYGLRALWLGRIAAFTTPAPDKVNGWYSVLDALLKEPPESDRPVPVYDKSLRELLQKLEQRSDAIVASILGSKTNV